jgi:oryzin
MATPHITGLILYLQSVEGLTDPTAIISRLKALGTVGKILGVPSGTVNLIGYNGASGA